MPDNVSKYGTAFDSLSVKPSVSQADASTHTPEETNFEVLRREQILREMRDCHSLRKGYLLASFIASKTCFYNRSLDEVILLLDMLEAGDEEKSSQ